MSELHILFPIAYLKKRKYLRKYPHMHPQKITDKMRGQKTTHSCVVKKQNRVQFSIQNLCDSDQGHSLFGLFNESLRIYNSYFK